MSLLRRVLPHPALLCETLPGLNLVGCDLVEVSPPYDPSGNTALNAASNVDTLLNADFVEDQILLDNDIFTALLSTMRSTLLPVVMELTSRSKN